MFVSVREKTQPLDQSVDFITSSVSFIFPWASLKSVIKTYYSITDRHSFLLSLEGHIHISLHF